jgi:type I restriction enzyme S subunit
MVITARDAEIEPGYKLAEAGVIPDDWKVSFWGKLATLEYGKSLRGYENIHGSYPVYGTNGLIGTHTKMLCRHPGVIVGRKGAYRGIHFSKEPFYVIDTAYYLEPSEDIDLKWAYYELLTHDINRLDSGSAIPSTSRETFYNLLVIVPPFSEQRAIAAALSDVDALIASLQRSAEELSDVIE